MTFKTILACPTTSEAAPALSKAGAALSSRVGAYLVGLHTIAALLREAVNFGADMTAVSATGHSRAHDFVVDSSTGRLMREADLPVLFAR